MNRRHADDWRPESRWSKHIGMLGRCRADESLEAAAITRSVWLKSVNRLRPVPPAIFRFV